MDKAELLAVRHLLRRIETCAVHVVDSLRLMEANRQMVIHRNATELMKFVATLDVGLIMGSALMLSQQIEQLLAKLRDKLPEIDDIDQSEFWKE